MSYGIILTEEDIKWNNQKLFDYLEAVINAEQINPDMDYENERRFKILKKIAICDLGWVDRKKLVCMLMDFSEDDD